MKRKIKIVLAVLVVLLLAGGAFSLWAFGAPGYPTPSGPHPVGTLEVSFRDGARTERLGPEPGGPREVGVRIWYPAAPGATGAKLPTLDGRVNKAFSEVFQAPVGAEDGPPSASIIDAQPLAEGGRLPVVLFSHGGFAHRRQNLSTMEALASQGLIVVSIGHSHESVLALLPRGRSAAVDPLIARGMAAFTASSEAAMDDYMAAIERMREAADRESGVAAARELGRVMTKMLSPLGHSPAELLELRHGDIALVIAKLAELDADPEHPLRGRYDLSRVGIFGHSLGAHAALSACLDPAIPVQACLSLDTPYYLVDDRPVPTLARPVLIAAAGATQLPTDGSNRYLLRGATAEALSVVVDGAAHMNFTDMSFMPRLMRLAGVLGSLEGGRAATITSDLTVSFFRRHLMGERQEWLDAPGGRYPELR